MQKLFSHFLFWHFPPFSHFLFRHFPSFSHFLFCCFTLFRTFCNTHPHFCIQKPAPEITEAEFRNFSFNFLSLQTFVPLVKTVTLIFKPLTCNMIHFSVEFHNIIPVF